MGFSWKTQFSGPANTDANCNCVKQDDCFARTGLRTLRVSTFTCVREIGRLQINEFVRQLVLRRRDGFLIFAIGYLAGLTPVISPY